MSQTGGSVGTVGAVGTMVWDTIVLPGGADPFNEWGGLAYSLAAMSATLGEAWTVRPIVKVGRDLHAEALAHLEGLPGVSLDEVRSAEAPNNRVELRYRSPHERVEILSGGVPEWTVDELVPAVSRCDALYLNFISGFELSLDTAIALRDAFEGPIYADLHSLFLGIDDAGRRIPRCPEHVGEWFGMFDVVQMNRVEADLMEAEGVSLAAAGPAAVVVTEGPLGATYSAVPAMLRTPPKLVRSRESSPRTSTGRIVPDPHADVVDPTGCGDVWGGTCFAALAAGSGLPESAERATRGAEVALGVRGTSKLFDRLIAARAPQAAGP